MRNEHDYADPEYPQPTSWADRIVLEADFHVYRLEELTSENKLTWSDVNSLKHVYGCYFNDMTELVKAMGDFYVVWGYETNDTNDDYYGLKVPQYAVHDSRLQKARNTLFEYLDGSKIDFAYQMETDFILFRTAPISPEEMLSIKLVSDLNLVDLSEKINLLDLLYVD